MKALHGTLCPIEHCANLSKIQSNVNTYSCSKIRNLAKIWGFSNMSINQPSDLGLPECIFKTVFLQN